jgi:putative ABC transport system permease protein
MSSYLSLLQRFILRDLMKDWVRTSLTVAGIALGVAVLVSISVANYTALSKFRETVDVVAGKANLEIRPASTAGVNQSVLKELSWLWDMGGKFTPVIQENVVVPATGVGGNTDLVQMIGIDMLADSDFKHFQQTTRAADSFLDVFSENAVLVGQKLATKHNLQIGSNLVLMLNDKLKTFKVTSILSGEGLGGAYSGNCVVADIRTAQEACDMPGIISQIEVIVPPPQLAFVQEKLKHDLPPTLSIVRPAQRGEQIEKITKSFEYNLMALTLIALMVGMFLIYNTMTISVIRRRPEIGTLRALGLSRGKVLALFAGENLFFGTMGTLIGIGLGLAFADGTLKAIAGTYQHFYFQDPLEAVTINPWTVVAAFFIGVSLTFAAGFAPVLEAASVSPAEATRRASYEHKVSRLSGRLALAGVLLFVTGGICCLQSPVYDFPLFGYAASLSFILGFALIMPAALNFILPLLSVFLQWAIKPEGRIAARSLQGTLARTAVATASLMIGIAMMVSLAIMIGSFRQTVTIWIDQTLKADLWMQSGARGGGSHRARLKKDVTAVLKSLPGVAAVDPFVDCPIEYEGEPTNLGAGDFDVIRDFGHLKFLSGETNKEVCSRMDENSAIVSETFAIRRHISVGDQLALPSPSGPLALKVQAIYYDYASDLGYIVMTLPAYQKNFHDDTISSFAIYLRPAADAEQVRTSIFNHLGTSSQIVIRTTRELKREAMKIFDRTFSVTYALHTIAIVVSMLAVMNALFALTLESRREFGILRYLGASDSQLRKIVLIEAAILGVTGNVFGLILGFILSFLLIFVINKQSFGWTVQLFVPIEFLVQSTLLVIATAIVAGIAPARMAARTLAPSVVRDE